MTQLAYTINENNELEMVGLNESFNGHKAQDVYCGYNAHQERLEPEYGMSRPYNKYEEALLAEYRQAKKH